MVPRWNFPVSASTASVPAPLTVSLLVLLVVDVKVPSFTSPWMASVLPAPMVSVLAVVLWFCTLRPVAVRLAFDRSSTLTAVLPAGWPKTSDFTA